MTTRCMRWLRTKPSGAVQDGPSSLPFANIAIRADLSVNSSGIEAASVAQLNSGRAMRSVTPEANPAVWPPDLPMAAVAGFDTVKQSVRAVSPTNRAALTQLVGSGRRGSFNRTECHAAVQADCVKNCPRYHGILGRASEGRQMRDRVFQ